MVLVSIVNATTFDVRGLRPSANWFAVVNDPDSFGIAKLAMALLSRIPSFVMI